MTVHPRHGHGEIDWTWLEDQPVLNARPLVRHVRLEEPLDILIDSRHQLGLICRP